MKQIARLLLVVTLTSTFMYNVVGLYLAQFDKKEAHWIAKIERSNTKNFQVLKRNASVYSFIEDTDLEEVNENIVINNKVYHVFKKQILNNILYLYYLPNSVKTAQNLKLTKMVEAEMDETPSSNKKPIEKIMKSLVKDYLPSTVFSFETPFIKENSHPAFAPPQYM
jgi:hypothetical protein